jgi:alanine-glyoxylate transaminase/serine-glyoxylate transaminase/serine-pyruvate transaminase
VRGRLLRQYGLEIGAGLGALAGKVWRIGLMGWSSRPQNVLYCVSALGAVLNDLGAKADTGTALDRVQRALDA